MIVILKCFLIQNRIYFIFSELNVCEIKLYKEQNKRNSGDKTMKKRCNCKGYDDITCECSIITSKRFFSIQMK